MITKQEMINIIKNENKIIQTGNDVDGYTQFTPAQYDAQIVEWADARLAKEQAKTDAEALRLSKISAYQKLGLTEAEIEALLPTPKPEISKSALAHSPKIVL